MTDDPHKNTQGVPSAVNRFRSAIIGANEDGDELQVIQAWWSERQLGQVDLTERVHGFSIPARSVFSRQRKSHTAEPGRCGTLGRPKSANSRANRATADR